MICEKDKCTGCFACYNVCPKSAIQMNEDEFGFIYPEIDKSKCINCNLCKKICPVINKLELQEPLKCLAARAKDEDVLKNSSSGGIATVISKNVIENKGIIYGSVFSDNCTINHTRIDKIEDLKKTQGSKYVHSYINNCYSLIKKDLENKHLVLFIGTPCQVAGLKNYLRKDYELLYTIDLICHGVPSQKFLKDEVNRINHSLDIDRVDFRDKKYKERNFSIKKDNNVIFNENWKKSPYFFTFMNSYTLRDNCYSCSYSSIKRCSDMTIGDFWGIPEESKFYSSKEKGVSVLIPTTPKGLHLIELIEDNIEYEERNIEETIVENSHLRNPSEKSRKVDKFKKEYLKRNNFYKSYKKVFFTNYLKQELKKNKLVSNILKIKKGVKNGKK